MRVRGIMADVLFPGNKGSTGAVLLVRIFQATAQPPKQLQQMSHYAAARITRFWVSCRSDRVSGDRGEQGVGGLPRRAEAVCTASLSAFVDG